MARNLVPSGLLASGNYGVLLDPATGNPLASVYEVLTVLPSVASADNFPGRAVFETSSATPFIFSNNPTPQWIALEGVPAQVDAVGGVPPVLPTPQNGSLFWDLNTQVLFVWDGTSWEPAGGRFAAQFIENKYTGNGVTLSYPTGASTAIQPQHVEVFLNGVRQYPTTDYVTVGTNVNFILAPASGVVIFIRAVESQGIVQNSQIESAVSSSTGGQTDFSTGVFGSDPAGVFVHVNGILQSGGGEDYNLIQQDTQVVSLTKTTTTTLRATTNTAHGIIVGSSVSFDGVLEPEYNNQSFTVTNVPSTTTFEVAVLASDSGTGTPNPAIAYSPAFVNDIVRFVSPLGGGETVDIRALRSVVVEGVGVGESNTLGSLGTGVSIVAAKVGEVLQTKSIKASSNVTILDNGTEIAISANNGLSFEDRIAINASVYQPTTESMVGVRNTSIPVTIDLTLIAQDPSNSGRRLTIKDESLAAGSNNITISAGAALIEGIGSYIINTNGGSVTLVMDGSNWSIIGEKI